MSQAHFNTTNSADRFVITAEDPVPSNVQLRDFGINSRFGIFKIHCLFFQIEMQHCGCGGKNGRTANAVSSRSAGTNGRAGTGGLGGADGGPGGIAGAAANASAAAGAGGVAGAGVGAGAGEILGPSEPLAVAARDASFAAATTFSTSPSSTISERRAVLHSTTDLYGSSFSRHSHIFSKSA